MDKPLPSPDEINARLTRVPFNIWLGLKLESVDGEVARLRLPWRDEIGGAPGMIHGGVLAAMVDIGCYAALLMAHDQVGPTIDMRVDFHANGSGDELIIEGRVVKAGRSVSTSETRILDARGRLLASGRCAYLVNRGEPGGTPIGSSAG